MRLKFFVGGVHLASETMTTAVMRDEATIEILVRPLFSGPGRRDAVGAAQMTVPEATALMKELERALNEAKNQRAERKARG
jgi:hypothetical protein